MSETVRLRQRGAIADAMLGMGATILLLQSASGSTRSYVLTGIGAALVLVGLALLWGVPRPSYRRRIAASLAGLFAGYAVVAPEGPASWWAIVAAVLLLGGVLVRAGRRSPAS